jgi:hypothetical protein
MPHHTLLGTTQHERFMQEVTREFDTFEQHEREFRAEEKRERLEELEATVKEPPQQH